MLVRFLLTFFTLFYFSPLAKAEGQCAAVFAEKKASGLQVQWSAKSPAVYLSSGVIKVRMKEGSTQVLRIPAPVGKVHDHRQIKFSHFANSVVERISPALATSTKLVRLRFEDAEKINTYARVLTGVNASPANPGIASLSEFHQGLKAGSYSIERDPVKVFLIEIVYSSILSRSFINPKRFQRMVNEYSDLGWKNSLSAKKDSEVNDISYLLSFDEFLDAVSGDWKKISWGDRKEVYQLLSSVVGERLDFDDHQFLLQLYEFICHQILEKKTFDTLVQGLYRVIMERFPYEVRQQLAEVWALYSFLGIRDPHAGNWMISSDGKIKIVDLAYVGKEFLSGASLSTSRLQSLFDSRSLVSSELLLPVYSKYFSPDFVANMLTLNESDLQNLAQQSGLRLSPRQLNGLLTRRDQIMAEYW